MADTMVRPRWDTLAPLQQAGVYALFDHAAANSPGHSDTCRGCARDARNAYEAGRYDGQLDWVPRPEPAGPVTIGGVEQVKADDPRLKALWETIQKVAADHGTIAQYDQMAGAMGGPKRKKRKQYTFRVPVTITLDLDLVSIAPTAKEARELLAREMNGNAIEQALRGLAGTTMENLPSNQLIESFRRTFATIRSGIGRDRVTIVGVPEGAKVTTVTSTAYD